MLRRGVKSVLFALLAVAFVGFSSSPARAACEPDGFNHPSVSIIFGQQTDPGTCNEEVISGCNATLVSPTVAITSAACAAEWASADGFNLTATWLSHNPDTYLDCAGADRIASYHVHPSWDGSQTSPYNIGVIVLESPSAQPPASLPASGDVGLLLRGDPLDVAAFSQSGTGVTTITRRADAVEFARATDFYFKVKTGRNACPSPEGSGAFEPASQDILGMSIGSQAGYLRLDIPEVRSFLADYVTLP